jgi:hypothetical protein
MNPKKTYKILTTLERVQKFYLDQVVVKKLEIQAAINTKKEELITIDEELRNQISYASELLQHEKLSPHFSGYERKYEWEKKYIHTKITELDVILKKVQEQLVSLYQEKEVSTLLKEKAQKTYEKELDQKEQKEVEELSIMRYTVT